MTDCFNVVRGKRIRATVLDECGAPPAAETADSQVTSNGMISVQYTLEYEDGDEHIQKNANGDLCIVDRSCDLFKRVAVTISLCGIDPDLIGLIAGLEPEVDAAGQNVGIRISDDTPCTNFGFELWSGVGDNSCPTTNEVVTLTEGGADLESFTLTFAGETTASIDADATAAEVQLALEGIDAIDPGDIDVVETQDDPFVFTITFMGRYAGQNVGDITATPSGGTGTVTVDVAQEGGQATAEYGYMLLPFVKNGTLRDFTVENGPTTFEVQGWTEHGTGWGVGPYEVVRNASGTPTSLEDALTEADHGILRVTTVPPPDAVCGYQALPAAPTATS